MEKVCIKCLKSKDITNFNRRQTSKDGYNNTCKECSREYSIKHYNNNKEVYIKKAKTWDKKQLVKFVEYLKTQECKDCGEKDIVVLEFDHLRDKEFNISSKIGVYPFYKIMEEIKKCEVVCSNCHKRRTAKQFGWFKCL